MCVAILVVTFRTEQQTVKCETEESLAERINQYRENENVMSYRVFRSEAKFVRTISWEKQE